MAPRRRAAEGRDGSEPSQSVAADDRRERILAVAARLFAERGSRNVSVRDIAVAAGVTHPLIYYYWSSKEDLLAAALEESQARVRRAAIGEPAALDAILAMVRETLDHNRQYLQTLTRALLDGMPPSEWPGGYPGIEAALRLLTSGLEPTGREDREARERLACGLAALVGWSVLEDQLLEMVGLTSADREQARRALMTSIREVLEPATRGS
jgi:AcrR family transcriptional regulator